MWSRTAATTRTAPTIATTTSRLRRLRALLHLPGVAPQFLEAAAAACLLTTGIGLIAGLPAALIAAGVLLFADRLT
jgi:hypothetical protein